jgi:2'-hydroxyisoflavone reductase
MNVLIVGGTRFVGRHMAAAFVERGHHVTLFNRGTDPSVHADLEQIHGDRISDLRRLDGRTWDAVVDACGYTPDVVETSAAYFRDRTARYVFVSTISVYDHDCKEAPDEDAPLFRLPAGADSSQQSSEHYGALKALCENAVRAAYGHATIVRPGLVAGPHDPTDRFTYWPLRFDRGGTLLAPPSERCIQYIDARDLAAFVVNLVERNVEGTYNCVTPPGALTFADLYRACAHEAAAEDAQTVEASDEFLEQHGVQHWTDLPLWLPKQWEHMVQVGSSRAVAAGLRTRPLAETVREVLAWAREAGRHTGALESGLSPAREAELLRRLR